MTHDTGQRGYTEEEASELIRRATELHAKAAGSSEGKLSLDEIQKIASELGLPAEYLQAAAAEGVGISSEEQRFSLLGGPFVVDESRLVPGVMTEEQWARAVLELRRQTGSHGHTSDFGNAQEWVHFTGEGPNGANLQQTRVTARPADGSTSLQLQKRFGGVALLYPLVLVLGVALTLVRVNEVETPMALIGGLLATAGSLAGVRALIKNWSRRQKERLSGLADALQSLVAAEPVLVAAQPEMAVDAAEGFLDLEPETDPAPTRTSASYRTRIPRT